MMLTIVVGSEMYPSYSSSDDEEESIFSCLVSGNLQTICAKSMNVYLNERIKRNESMAGSIDRLIRNTYSFNECECFFGNSLLNH